MAVGVVVGQLLELLGSDRPVVGGDREARCALEDRQLCGLRGDRGNRLNARRSGTDDPDPLAGEVDGSMGPAAGEVHVARETLHAVDVELLRNREAARGQHEVTARDVVADIGADAIAGKLGVPAGVRDSGAESDVAPQVVLVGDVVQVTKDLGLGGVLLRPLPVARPVGVEAEHVVEAWDVDAGTRIAIPVPRAADVVSRLEDPHGQTGHAKAVRRVQARESRAYDHDIDVDIPHPIMMTPRRRSVGGTVNSPSPAVRRDSTAGSTARPPDSARPRLRTPPARRPRRPCRRAPPRRSGASRRTRRARAP